MVQCQCVIDDLYKRSTDFNYLSDSAIFNNYHNFRNNCMCGSRKAYSFGYIYCRRHKELLITFFPMTRVQLPASFVPIDLE